MRLSDSQSLTSGEPTDGRSFWEVGSDGGLQVHPTALHADAWQPIPTLTVEFEEGQPLERSGPVEIIDFGPEFGEKGIQVFVTFIPYPLYSELFPQHVERYRKHLENAVPMQKGDKAPHRSLMGCPAHLGVNVCYWLLM
jgi:hypothetical protein